MFREVNRLKLPDLELERFFKSLIKIFILL